MVAALLLLAAMLAMLFIGGDITFGAGPASANLPNWPGDVIALAGLATAGIALASPRARMPVGVTILAISAGITVVGPTDLLTFYDAGGLALGLGAACLAALWLVAIGRNSAHRWSEDPLIRAVLYLTLVVALVPTGVLGIAAMSCDADSDDMCGLAGVVFGFPAAVLAWVAVVIAGEVVAARRRRSRNGHGRPDRFRRVRQGR